MKIIYTINATYNSGGMERILSSKVNYLADQLNYEIVIVTTEQRNRPHFFPFSDKIRFIDIGINYNDDQNCNILLRSIKQHVKKRNHRRKLLAILLRERPDITISMFDRDYDFLYKLKDGSRKILEYHFSKYVKMFEARNILMKKIQGLRAEWWNIIIRRYDAFVVLTEADKRQWHALANTHVIPNFIDSVPEHFSNLSSKTVMAAGRASYQKGFDLLLEAWRVVSLQYPDWELKIVGGGDKTILEDMCRIYNLHNVRLIPATLDIGAEYNSSSLFVLPSRYEGFGLVLIEAMAHGLPIVSFDCPCGPRDIIDNSFGILVNNGNTSQLADAIMSYIQNPDKRRLAGANARDVAQKYEQKNIMNMWVKLFNQLLK